jgi:hypothetical protein
MNVLSYYNTLKCKKIPTLNTQTHLTKPNYVDGSIVISGVSMVRGVNLLMEEESLGVLVNRRLLSQNVAFQD